MSGDTLRASVRSDTAGRTLRIHPVRARGWYNGAATSDGAVWAGRGLTTAVDAGVSYRRGARFGDGANTRLDPGQSSIRVDTRGVAMRLTTANETWGPSSEHRLILGTAGGLPPPVHRFVAAGQRRDRTLARPHVVRTTRPVGLLSGTGRRNPHALRGGCGGRVPAARPGRAGTGSVPLLPLVVG